MCLCVFDWFLFANKSTRKALGKKLIMAKKKGAITTQRGKGQVVWEFRGQGEEGLFKCKKKTKAEAAEKKRTGGTRRARSERGHQNGPQAACESATARR